MAVFALLLAVEGGVALAVASVVEVPTAVLVVALLAWLTSLVLVVADASARSRREGTTLPVAAGRGVKEAGRWVRDFMP